MSLQAESYFQYSSVYSVVSSLWKTLPRENSASSLSSLSTPVMVGLFFSCYSFRFCIFLLAQTPWCYRVLFTLSNHCILCSCLRPGSETSLLGHAYLFTNEEAISVNVFSCPRHSLLKENNTYIKNNSKKSLFILSQQTINF